jgi:protein-S-isoprenylcysteine O-methyltransferase Ste14
MLAGRFILLVGLGILFQSLSLIFIFTPVLVLLNLTYLKAIEEKEMERKFGEDYLRYKREIPMFFPRFKKRNPPGVETERSIK